MEIRQGRRERPTRINLRAPLRYQIRGGSEFGNAISNNISVGGVSFITYGFIAPQTPLMIEFSLLSRVLRPAGKVAWSISLPHTDKKQLGVQFLEFDIRERDYLLDYIKMREKHG